jgi:hypothetical protein
MDEHFELYLDACISHLFSRNGWMYLGTNSYVIYCYVGFGFNLVVLFFLLYVISLLICRRGDALVDSAEVSAEVDVEVKSPRKYRDLRYLMLLFFFFARQFQACLTQRIDFQ